jgi:hypothetical protein
MKTTFGITALTSTHQWLDNYIQNNGQAYINTTSQLFYQADPSLNPAYVAYAAPFKSFVWDSGVAGATIIDRVSGSFGTIVNGQSGMMIDYENARVLFPVSFGKNKVVSGSYAFKELNVYKSNETQEQIVFSNKYYLNSRFARPISGLPPPNAMVTPCVFLTNSYTKNDPFALGGIYNTQKTISLVVMAENSNQLEGMVSLLTDAKDTCFPALETNVWPLNAMGGLKSGYNYETVKSQYGQPGNLFTITEVEAGKVSDYTKIDQSIFLALIDLTVEKVRTIH